MFLPSYLARKATELYRIILYFHCCRAMFVATEQSQLVESLANLTTVVSVLMLKAMKPDMYGFISKLLVF